jgi:RNA polymerase sigma-70 factor (ECF subfamily)
MESAALSDEPSLVEAARSGDPEAFAELVARHQKMVHDVTYRMTGSQADAADVAQEAFIRAWRELDRFRGEGEFGAWIHRIALNTALNWLKAIRRRGDLHRRWAESDTGPDVDREGLAGRVLAALDRLDPDARAAIVLTVYEGLNHAQAAQVLGCAETTVSWRIWRARRRLKAILSGPADREGRTP